MSLSVLHVVGNAPAPFVNDLVLNQMNRSDLSVRYAIYKRKKTVKELLPRADYVDQNVGWFERFVDKLPGARIHGAPKGRLRRIKRLLDQDGVQVIHAHFGWSVWSCMEPLFQFYDLDLPVLVSVHGTDVLSKIAESDERREIFLRFCARPRVHIAVASDFMRDEVLKLGLGPEKIARISNTVPEGLFERPANRRLDEVFRVVCTARFVRWKGHDVLIRAFARFLEQQGCAAQLILIGGGSEEGRLRALVKSLGLTRHVEFTGWIQRKAINEHLGESDLYVQPSLHDAQTNQCETFGIAILEAILAGLPVIVSDCGGIPEVVGDDRRYSEIIAQNDVAALTDAIGHAYSKRNEPFDNRRYARKRMERFSPQRQLEECLAAYQELTAG